MARATFPLLILFLFIFLGSLVESDEQGWIVAEVSEKGLDFVKDLLTQKAESSLVPIELPKIEKAVHVPFVGNVGVVLSGIVIQTINLNSSTVKTGDSGIVLYVSGGTASMGLMWEYSYRSWWLPFSFSDQGNASIQVQGMEVGLTLGLKTIEGSLTLSVLDSGCFVNDISIELNGGASWLYQGLIDAFEGRIESAVEDAVSGKLSDAIVTLNSVLKSLPKEAHVTKDAALNLTFVNDPQLKESSVHIEINGLFSPNNETALSSSHNELPASSEVCCEANKMVGISVQETVLESATSAYFVENKMHWTVQQLPDPKYLNTKWWRFVIPRLYKSYPNHNMSLDVSVISLPKIQVTNKQITANAPLDVVINVLDEEEVVPVASISVDLGISASPEISANTLTGNLQLNDFDLSLNWSNIGDLHISLLQTLASTALRSVVFPYINLKLYRGFKIPSFQGFTLEDAQIICTDDSWIIMCTDIAPTKHSPY